MDRSSEIDLPSGRDLTERWKTLSVPAQGDLWRKIRKGETSSDRNEALLIAAMAKQRLRGWTMRPEVVLPAFVAFFFLLSLVLKDFSFASSLTVPVIYAGYMILMRTIYSRAYTRNMEVLRGKDPHA